ncbi:MAG: hypothetical protein HQL31_01745 [Planctomycetes bacterium]|nr:hypothetical protein [Planctomycetota bacterium]
MSGRLRGGPGQLEINLRYSWLFVFASLFIFLAVSGILTECRAFLAVSVMMLFGVIISLVHILREPPTARGMWRKINRSKLEFIFVVSLSVIIVISSSLLLFSSLHLLFYHIVYSLEFSVAWIAMIAALIFCALSAWGIRGDRLSVFGKGTDSGALLNLMDAGFVFSLLIACSVPLSRMGFHEIDLIGALVFSLAVAGYGSWYLFHSLRGLMDASCGKDVYTLVKACLKEGAEYSLVDLKVMNMGKNLEILVKLDMPREARVGDAQKVVSEIRARMASALPRSHSAHIGFMGRL